MNGPAYGRRGTSLSSPRVALVASLYLCLALLSSVLFAGCSPPSTACPGGDGGCMCDAGFAGPACDQCEAGRFGSDCVGTCACVNGTCDEGVSGTGSCACDAGFAGSACDQCEPGRFGGDCAGTCACVNGTCDEGVSGTGACTCDTGWAGSQCDACDLGFFGSSCDILLVPRSIPNLALWLDASDTSTITEVAGAVSEIADRSENGNSATQAVAAQQPTSNAATLNGLNVLSFDGVDDTLTYNQEILAETSYSVFVVEQRLSNPASAAVMSGSGVLSAQLDILYLDSGATLRVAHGSAGTTNSTVTPGTSPRLIGYTHSATNGNRTYIDGVLTSTNTGSTPDIVSPATEGRIGNRSNVMYFHGNIAEIIIYSRELSDVERQTIEAYLLAKWMP